MVFVERNAITTLANLCDGDARIALNSLQMAVQSRLSRRQGKSDSSGENLDSSSDSEIPEKEKSVDKGVILIVRTKHIEEGLKRSHVLYDRTGKVITRFFIYFIQACLLLCMVAVSTLGIEIRGIRGQIALNSLTDSKVCP